MENNNEVLKNFSEEQMKIYNYYKDKISCNENELALAIKEDQELIFMEKTYNILKKIFKVELVFALIIATFVILFNILPNDSIKSHKTTKSVAIVLNYDDK